MSLLHFLLEKIKVQLLKRFRLPANAILLGNGYPFGKRPKSRPIFLDLAQLQNPHMICTGGSGCGKTRLLYFLVTQLIRQSFPVVIVFDPHGDLHGNLLNFLAELPLPEVAKRLILIEPYEAYRRGRTPGINVLEVEGEDDDPAKGYELIDEQVGCFKVNWRDSWGERMSSILRNGFRLLQFSKLTLTEMPLLLMDKYVRGHLASHITDEDLLAFLAFFSEFKDSEQHFFVESARSRCEAFTQNPYIRRIIGQSTSTIRFNDLINKPGTVILINASRNHLKSEARRLFCSLLFSKLHAAILARENIPEEERIPLYIFADEAHEIYYPEAFQSILEGGRKFKSYFGGIFHQTLAQFDEFGEKDTEVILANTGVKAVFQVNRNDAERYAKEMFSFARKYIKDQPRDLLGTKGRAAYFSVQEQQENITNELQSQQVREMHDHLKDGKSNQPFVAVTSIIEYSPSDPEGVEALRTAFYTQYARPNEEIDAERKRRRQLLQNAEWITSESSTTSTQEPEPAKVNLDDDDGWV